MTDTRAPKPLTNVIPLPKIPRVLFCPFCGGGTLLMGSDERLWECLKCKMKFGVAVELK
jgi:ribosomal protein L37AE/L43A